MVLGTEAQNYFHESTQADFWIGGDNIEVAQKWSWTDGTPFDYSDWKTGEPQNTTGSNCIALSLTEAYWSADDCFKPKPYVCLVPSSTTTPKATTLETTTKRVLACPSDWIYLNYTGYCYKVYHNQLNWNGAEQVCTVVGGHIASIHSNTENDFLGNLQFEGRGIWLGFYLNLTYPFEWIWSDGTPVDYTNWSIGQPDGRGGTGCTEFYGHYAWNDIPCDHIYNNFVCKKYRSYI
uniref:C-type lectin domain-containing protein n=1 Tax=Panagrolaimus davidi TaxID=227884 RepID=A0A914QYU7_9BILA